LFIYYLFNDAASSSDYMALNGWMAGWLVNDKLESMWKEGAVTKFDVLFQQLPGKTEETIRIVTLQA
jgi:hypothetical protein